MADYVPERDDVPSDAIAEVGWPPDPVVPVTDAEVEAAARAAFFQDAVGGHIAGKWTYDTLPEVGRLNYRRMVRAALTAARPHYPAVVDDICGVCGNVLTRKPPSPGGLDLWEPCTHPAVGDEREKLLAHIASLERRSRLRRKAMRRLNRRNFDGFHALTAERDALAAELGALREAAQRVEDLLREVYEKPTSALGFGVIHRDLETGDETGREPEGRWRRETRAALNPTERSDP